MRCELKSAPLTRAGICENTGPQGEKRPDLSGAIRQGDTMEIMDISARGLLSQRRIFFSKPCSSQSGKKQELVIISRPSFWQLIRRGSTYHASLLSALLAVTDLSAANRDLCLLADTSTGQVLVDLGGEEGSRFTTFERQPKKPH